MQLDFFKCSENFVKADFCESYMEVLQATHPAVFAAFKFKSYHL